MRCIDRHHGVMTLTVSRTQTVDEFLATARPFLAKREAEHNLLFGICSTIQKTPEIFENPPRFAVVTDGRGTRPPRSLRPTGRRSPFSIRAAHDVPPATARAVFP